MHVSSRASFPRIRLPVSRERGQALVELALILPVFLLLTVGIVDFARIAAANIALSDGVRKAALWAAEDTNYLKWCAPAGSVACPTQNEDGTAADATGHTSADPDNVAHHVQSTGLVGARVSLRAPTIICNDLECTADRNVRIVASYEEVLLTPILGNIFGGKVTMTASTTMRIFEPLPADL